ncbi:MAG: hypothetical protein WBA63_08725 [Thermomicrobiales bacterium]
MTDATRHFTVDDLEYDVVTTLSTLLQSEDVLAQYAHDFEDAGKPEIAEIFWTLRNNNRKTATELRSVLGTIITSES